jgi:hypothetical protein
MTAIGFVVFVIGFALIQFAETYSYKRTEQFFTFLCVLMLFVGGVLMITGFAIKLWELMP